MRQSVDQLIRLMQAFLAGATSLEDAATLEGEFARCGLDDDETYSDLQYALAMYRGPGHEDSLQALRRECKWAIEQLARASEE
jgi:hypothetical protein